ncbi:MAG: Cro/CI family transcriptional regulator [Providencia sp.]|uniref:Cro/CI family transcriptional regulator n=1 Tax=Providencia sp. TaxID=589 RepID=UPI003F988880
MDKLALKDYVKQHGQDKTAKAIGVTQGAISKAIREGRNILLSNTDDGIKAVEIKPFPNIKR